MILLASLLALAAEAVAPYQPLPDEDVVVTATRTGQGGAVDGTIVTADTIARLQPHSALEALNDVAGVRAISTGGVGGNSFVSIRGGEPNFALVLLEGIRLNNPINSAGGAFDFGQIDPDLLESITVSRNGGSAIHGSDALSGVISMRLKDPPKAGVTALNVHALGRTDEARGTGADLASGWAGGGALLAGSWYDTGDGSPGASLRRRQAIGRVVQQAGDFQTRLVGVYAHADHDAFPEDSGGPRLAANREREHGTADLRLVGLAIDHAPAPIRPNLTINYSEQRDDIATPAIFPGVLDAVPALTARDRFTRFEAAGHLLATRGILSAAAGAAVRRETGRSVGTIDFGFPLPTSFTLDRTTTSGFAEASIRPLVGATLNLAGRHDAVSHGPSRWTGRAGVEWQPAAVGPALFARIGNGFKLPSFYALAQPLVGNPALRPERSRNAEAGMSWSWADDGQIRVAVYENRFRDLIDFDPVRFTMINRARVRARGFDADLRWTIVPGLVATAALGHVALTSETPLRDRPAWQGSAHLVWAARADLTLDAGFRFNSRFNDSSIPTGAVRTDGHVEIDTGLDYRISRILRLALTLRNLGDSRYQDAVGWPSPGRQLRATIRVAIR